VVGTRDENQPLGSCERIEDPTRVTRWSIRVGFAMNYEDRNPDASSGLHGTHGVNPKMRLALRQPESAADHT